MAYQRNPSDLNRTQELRAEELRRQQALDNELQDNLELVEGPASGGRMALFAIAVIAILGVVFYGLNNSASVTSTAQNPPATISTPAQQDAQTNTMSPANPNTGPGQTTGSAPAAPQSGTSDTSK